MARITLQQVSPMDFSGTNSMMAQSAQSYNNAFKTIQDTLKGVQTAIRGQNTDQLMSKLNEAQSISQFRDRNFQNDLNALREGLGGEYNREQFQTAMQARPMALINQETGEIQLTNAQNALADTTVKNKGLQDYLKTGDIKSLTSIMPDLKGDATQIVGFVDGLQNSQQQRAASKHGMQLGDAQLQLARDKFGLEQQAAAQQQQYAKAYMKSLGFDEKGNLIGGVTQGTGQSAGSPVQSQGRQSLSQGQLDQVIAQVAKEEGVSPLIIKAMIGTESSNQNGLISPAGARGYMQLVPGTAKELGVEGDAIWDPYTNIKAGTRYVKQQYEKFGNDWGKAFAAYNAGPGRVSGLIASNNKAGRGWSVGLPKETQDYLRKITGQLRGNAQQGAVDAKAIRNGTASPETKAFYNGGAGAGYDGGMPALGSGTPMSFALGIPGLGGVQGGDLKALKAQNKLLAGQQKMYLQNEQELIKAQLNNNGVLANLGKSGVSSLKNWGNAEIDDLTWGKSPSKDIKAVLSSHPDIKNLPGPMQVSIAETIAQEMIKAQPTRTWDQPDAFSKSEIEELANNTVAQFAQLQMQRDATTDSMLQQDFGNSVMEAQLRQSMETDDARKAFLKRMAGF